jgi:tetratricopeptide (TPR) repeat protein
VSDSSPLSSTEFAPGPANLTAGSGQFLPPTLVQEVGTRPGGSDPLFPGYVIHKEIARGGMGRVLAAHDLTLEREVALKVLLQDSPTGEMAERFRQEARITARLPHPGIPPVYALGDLPDGSPFLAMKLIKGRTLSALLRERIGPSDDLPLFVQVFEQVCQAVGFAHAQGIIHRDLKPSNVMVGAFGEVQVMDWGIAREMRSTECGVRNPIPAPAGDAPSVSHASDLTATGIVLGTPAYMAPEQARGEEPDPRADVFAIGGILCEILVERPPFVEDPSRTTIEAAAAGALADAFAALDRCGADAELVALAKRCLSPRRADRPADAKAVADAVAAYRAAVEDRLRTAETRRAAAEATAAEEANTRRAVEQTAAEQRKRRRAQSFLRAAVLVIGGLIAAGAWWQDRQAADRWAELARVEAERRGTRHGVERATELAAELRRQYRFRDAREVLTNAGELATRAGADDLRPVIDQAKADLEFVVALDEVRMRRSVWVELGGGRGRFREAEVPDAYAAAFAARGLDVKTGNPADIAARVATSSVRSDLVAALDDWSAIEPKADVRDRVLAVARGADPGDWLDRFRDPAVRADADRLRQLARDADPAALAPAAVTALAVVMQRRGLDPGRLLFAAQVTHPGDFLIAFELAQWFFNRDPEKAIGQFRTARAIRPDNVAVVINLAALLNERGDSGGGLECCREAVRLDPTNPLAHNNLGNTLRLRGDLTAAAASFREALRLDPRFANARVNLGVVVADMGDLAAAVECYRETLRLDPDHAGAMNNLGDVLKRQGDRDGAERYFRDAVRINPRYAMAHYNLGLCLRERGDRDGAEGYFRESIRLDPKFAPAHHGLGLVRLDCGDRDGAVRYLREAVRLDTRDAVIPYNLGNVLREKGDLDAAAESFREAISRNPRYAAAHVNLGVTLRAKGDTDGAVRCFREATRIDPDYSPGHEQLVTTFGERKDWPATEASLREVLRLNPTLAKAHFQMGLCRVNQDDIDGAMRSFREALRHDPTHAPSHTNLGYGLLSKGDLEGAERCFREAIRHDPQLPQPRTGLRRIEQARTAPPPRPVER